MPLPLTMSTSRALLGRDAFPVTDDFNRADNALTLGRANTGQAWNPLVRIWGVTSNQAQVFAGAGTGCVVIETRAANVQVEATAAVVVNSIGLAARVVDATNRLEAVYTLATTTWNINKLVAGATTSLGSGVQATSNGDRLTFALVGQSLVFSVNGVAVVSVSDSTFQTATQHGLRSASNTARFDDFRIARR